MAITATNQASGSSPTGGSASFNTAYITPPANKLVIISVYNAVASGTPNAPTLSGCGGSWQQIGTYLDSVNGLHRVTMFRDVIASPSLGYLTASFSSQTQASWGWSVDYFTGASMSGAHGADAIVQYVATNSSVGASTGFTINLATLSNANNAAYGFIRNNNSVTIVKGSSFSALSNSSYNEAEYAINQTAINWTWANTSLFSMAFAIEITAKTNYSLAAATQSFTFTGKGQTFGFAKSLVSQIFAFTGNNLTSKNVGRKSGLSTQAFVFTGRSFKADPPAVLGRIVLGRRAFNIGLVATVARVSPPLVTQLFTSAGGTFLPAVARKMLMAFASYGFLGSPLLATSIILRTETRIYSALIAQLMTFASDPIAIAYPGITFAPVSGQPYLRVSFLPAMTAAFDLQHTDDYRGVFQVDVFWPAQQGEILPLEMAESLIAYFQRGSVLRSPGLDILFNEPAYAGPTIQEPSWIQISVSIRYRALVTEI